MDSYSFLDHANIYLGGFFIKNDFLLNKSSSQILLGVKDSLLMFESKQCRIQIYLEHYRVYNEISILNTNDPNHWYNIDAMACFVSGTSPSIWIYNLPRGIPTSQVIEQQLARWQTILDSNFDKIMPLFVSEDKYYETQEALDKFTQNFYSEQKRLSPK